MVGKEQLALNLELKTWTPFKSITDIQTVQTQRALEAAELGNLY